jgi:hypothetical protein
MLSGINSTAGHFLAAFFAAILSLIAKSRFAINNNFALNINSEHIRIENNVSCLTVTILKILESTLTSVKVRLVNV